MGHFNCYAETAQLTPRELNAALNPGRLLPVSELAISEQTGFHVAWETGGQFSPLYAVTMKRSACFLFFMLVQFPHFSSPSVLLLYKNGSHTVKTETR